MCDEEPKQAEGEKPSHSKMTQGKRTGDSLREDANIEWVTTGQYVLMDRNTVIFILKGNDSIMDYLNQLNAFFVEPRWGPISDYFKDDRQRFSVKITCSKLINDLGDKLIEEKLDPISIKIDCDKNKFPDIIQALKDNRNWV